MKLIKKNDCVIKNGYVTVGDEVIGLPEGVFHDLDRLNYMVQAAAYNKENRPEARKPVAPFKPKLDYFDHHGVMVEPETPELDAAVERGLAIAKDIKKMSTAEKLNELANSMKHLLTFVEEDEFLEGVRVDRLGIPEDWNIFEWTVEDLMDLYEGIAEDGDRPFNEPKCDADFVVNSLFQFRTMFN